MNTPNHELTLTDDRYGRTWTCSCGLWNLRADYGWTRTPEGDHLRPVPAYTPGAAHHHHTLHLHHAENPTTLRNP